MFYYFVKKICENGSRGSVRGNVILTAPMSTSGGQMTSVFAIFHFALFGPTSNEMINNIITISSNLPWNRWEE